MEQYVANSFDKNYAAAWSADQGGFSSQLSRNLLDYIDKNHLQYTTCLDICCGTGEFINLFNRSGFKCAGTEIAKSMIDVSKERYPQVTFALADNIYDIPVKGKFDVITCNHDVVNLLEKFSEWETLFKNVYSTLNKDGLFMFDYYTKFKLENWNETTFEESDNMDHVSCIKKGIDNKTIINEIYYMKDQTGKYSKTFDILVESYFDNADIVSALRKAGFKSIDLVDFSLEQAANVETRKRMHVIARK